MAAIRDTRVDVCLYFVPPHRLRQVGLFVWASVQRVSCRLDDLCWGGCSMGLASSAAQRPPPWVCRCKLRNSSCHPSPLASLQIDLQFICDLAAVVPVVPVLSKADTMTSEELKARLLRCCRGSFCLCRKLGGWMEGEARVHDSHNTEHGPR